jgi:hypothetical protein
MRAPVLASTSMRWTLFVVGVQRACHLCLSRRPGIGVRKREQKGHVQSVRMTIPIGVNEFLHMPRACRVSRPPSRNPSTPSLSLKECRSLDIALKQVRRP